ncbi:MAG: alcohol dehydrogenase [Alteromonadaceae bacterium]|uniref:iron-containing alcohol dehydrogenase n=1 Tax=unclassified Marinobacter TaxID=83889 RepID=UPI000C568A30|nr:iron-containing alcohol dehydrogenase [Marinobacter sp. BGYM27]MAA65507.1 alcohol dehydrogenase [Alteromonadaceae bacterium]MBH86089.1 alcohol dehydrogenase [Alteromonadaceae bacterium]MDG5498874.1 iron-containing alcohol dehydrogenase [Marinobacter sp. BGYM27]|tara:strand:+ start:7355 stop:8542 length:1188 start_codon:yes stop_codon:yes gene_type:complete
MSQRYYEFFCPVKVIAGKAALEHIPYELAGLSATRPLLITDKGVRAAGLLEPVIEACEEGGQEIVSIYDDVPPDSSTHVVKAIAAVYREQKCDSIIAVGGGSAIDTAKAVNILVSEGGNDLSAYAGAGVLKRALKPFFVVPTTAGTGSEVTSVAVIADLEKSVKLPFTSSFLLPNAAIIDPRMTLTLPPHITAATAMDALTHATEAFTCLAKNPLSDAYATAAVRKITDNLLHVMKHPKDADGRLELAQASTMAGIAFSNSMVGLVHSLGHATGAICHLPHGLCMSLYMPYVLEYNLENIRDSLSDLLIYMVGPDVYATTPANQRAEACISAIRKLRDELYQLCKLPRTLQETGKVTEDQLERIARTALDDGSIMFNPREVTFEDAMAVLKRAWG